MKSFKNKTKWKSSRKMALRVKVLAPQVLQPEFGPWNPRMEDSNSLLKAVFRLLQALGDTHALPPTRVMHTQNNDNNKPDSS